jgi:hypothetical protein
MKAKLIIILLVGILIGIMIGGILAPGIMAGETFKPIVVAGADYDYEIFQLLKNIAEDVENIKWNISMNK